MKNKALKYACLGFVLGMIICNLIVILIGLPEFRMVSPVFEEHTGSTAIAILIQTILSGIYGMIIWLGILLYGEEELPLALATFLHYLCVALPYIPLALFLGWVETWGELVFIELFQLAGFFVIWIIMDLRYKAQVKELNELQEEYRKKENTGTSAGMNIQA